jgi:hypothetical protein
MVVMVVVVVVVVVVRNMIQSCSRQFQRRLDLNQEINAVAVLDGCQPK